jgi:hypothetical protein
MEILLDSRGLLGSLVDCGLVLQRGRGFFGKWQGFPGFEIIFEWKIHMDRVHGLSTTQGVADPRVYHRLNRGQRPRLTGVWPSGHSGARRLTVRKGKRIGRRTGAKGTLTGAWTTARQRRDGGRALSPSSDSVDMI